MGSACTSAQREVPDASLAGQNGKQQKQPKCFADRKASVKPTSQFVNVSTSFDPTRITHDNPRLPGVTVSFVTGDLETDVRALWISSDSDNNSSSTSNNRKNDNSTKSNNSKNRKKSQQTPSNQANTDTNNTINIPSSKPKRIPAVSESEDQKQQYASLNSMNNKNKFNGYWPIIEKEILEDDYFPYPLLGITKENLSSMQYNGGIPLLPRTWHIEDKTIMNSNGKTDSDCFTVLQFNMLADGLSGAYYNEEENNSKAFLNVNPRCLEWSYRGVRLIQDILVNSQWNGDTPDIIALEECDQFEWILSYLKCYGYDGQFVSKSDTPCPSVAKDLKDEKERGNDIDLLCRKYGKNGLTAKDWTMSTDGCAVFWKKSKFSCFDETKIIKKSNSLYVCDTRPEPPNMNSALDIFHAGVKEWQPYSIMTEISEWNEKKEEMIKETNDIIGKTESLLNSGEIKNKKLIKKYEKTIKDKKKFLKGIKSFDASKDIPNGAKFQPILSEEKGKLIQQATTFMCVPLQWKNNKKKRFYAMVCHLKSTKSREGERVRVGQLHGLFGKGDIFGNRLLDVEKDGFDESLPILYCIDLNGKHSNTYIDDTIENDSKLKEDPSNIEYCHEAYDMITANSKDGGLGFQSVSVLLTNKEPDYTTWKQRRDGPSKHTIDFVFLRNFSNLLKPVAHLELVKPDKTLSKQVEQYEQNMKVNNEGLIPDWHYPSDHLSLVFRMQWLVKD